MVQIDVRDEVAAHLAEAAASRGCDPADLASALLAQALGQQEDFELSPETETLLLQRIKQSERGEFITSEQVGAKFAALFHELESR